MPARRRGPWEYDGSRCVYVPEEFRYPDADSALFCGHWKPNAALIAHYRTAAPLLADEVERLNAVNEEHRLTLAAEQGKPEGAASDRWRVSYNRHGFEWWRGEDDDLPEVECHLSGGEWRWTKPGFESNPYPTARACMLAADKDGT